MQQRLWGPTQSVAMLLFSQRSQCSSASLFLGIRSLLLVAYASCSIIPKQLDKHTVGFRREQSTAVVVLPEACWLHNDGVGPI